MPGKFLFYANALTGDRVEFDETEARHAFKTLRYRAGDEIFFSDGKGHTGRARIDGGDTRAFSAIILDKHLQPRHLKLRLAIGLIKNTDRIEWLVEKATELGVMELLFFRAGNSEKGNIHADRLQKIAIAALKQSHGAWLPEIRLLDSIRDIPTDGVGAKFISHCRDMGAVRSFDTDLLQPETLCLIGPEGDFTALEISWAHANDFKDMALGSSILRTESAALLLASVHYLCCK